MTSPIATAGRAATALLLTPIVLVFSVATLIALALVGTLRLMRTTLLSMRADPQPAAADVHFLATAKAERVESVAARQAA